LITQKSVAKHFTEDQLNHVTFDQMKNLRKGHPLWGRIGSDLIKELDPAMVNNLSSSQLPHVKEKAQIRAISFWKVKHLTKEQLKQRSWAQFIAYTIGVTLLGVASAIFAALAYISLIPFAVLLVSRRKGKYLIKKINANPQRLFRHIQVYAG
jgi:hypothetical protein